ncbi:acyltransferase [Rothia sp. P5766]|uniref:acyltransferase n=1 Tax=Rothia sp. P5766 TaxID=3402656 RepID=UPI003ADFF189
MIRRTIVEKIPSLRWKTSSLISRRLYSAAFKKFGEKSVIVSPLKLRGLENISLGKNVSIFEGCWLQAEAEGELMIGDSVYVGHRCHIHAYDQVSIGSNTVIADNVLINSAEHLKENLAQVQGTGPITIGEHVFIGQNAVILGGVTIGDNAVVGAGAVVTRDVPVGATVAGVPARAITSPSNA